MRKRHINDFGYNCATEAEFHARLDAEETARREVEAKRSVVSLKRFDSSPMTCGEGCPRCARKSGADGNRTTDAGGRKVH